MLEAHSDNARSLISSDRVEGTAVYDPSGRHIGSIDYLMIERVTGNVAYAIVAFGGFLGFGEETFALPWKKFQYDTALGGYRTDVNETELKGSPTWHREDETWSDPRRAREYDEYWMRPGF